MNTIINKTNASARLSQQGNTGRQTINLFEHFQDFSFCPLEANLQGKAKTVTILDETDPIIMIIRCAEITFQSLHSLVSGLHEKASATRLILLGYKASWTEVQTLTALGVFGIAEATPKPEILKRMIDSARQGYVSVRYCKTTSKTQTAVSLHKVDSHAANIHLTAREQEVLNLIIRGYQNREIAAELILSRETVKTHVKHLLEKFSVTNRTNLAILALENQAMAKISA